MLYRVVRREAGGLAHEADMLHAEILRAAEPQRLRSVVVVPGSRPSPTEQEGDEELAAHEIGLFRSCAASENYLSRDRPDLAYATR